MLPAGMQEFCDQASVAPPPQGLRAHQAGSRLGQRRGERLLPPLSAHAGGVAAEGGDAKAAEGILARLTGEAAAKLDGVPIGDPALLEHRSESRFVELGVVTRARKASHVDERAGAGLADNRHELFRRPSPMPDRPDGHRARMPGWIPLRAGRKFFAVADDDRRHPRPVPPGSGVHDRGHECGAQHDGPIYAPRRAGFRRSFGPVPSTAMAESTRGLGEAARAGRVSFWLASAPRFGRLEGRCEADVAVAGAGIVGLTAALLLTEAGKDVLVVEADRIAARVSGYTSAKVTAGHGLIYSHLEGAFDSETARFYAESQTAGLT